MINIDWAGIVALLVFGWVGGHAIGGLWRLWRGHRKDQLEARIMARRRYLQALPQEEWRDGKHPARLIHEACRTNHLPWEACPAAQPRMGVGRMYVVGSVKQKQRDLD